MAQQSHGRHHADIRPIVESEDLQEKNGVGMEMKGLQPVMAEDSIEEVREGGTRPATTLLMKKGEKVLP